ATGGSTARSGSAGSGWYKARTGRGRPRISGAPRLIIAERSCSQSRLRNETARGRPGGCARLPRLVGDDLSAHRLPPRLLASAWDYCRESVKREAKRCPELVEPLVARRARQPSYRSSSNRKYQVGKSPCRSRLLAPSNFALDQRSRSRAA